MKYIFLLLLSFAFLNLKAQLPTGVPTQKINGWAESNYYVPDSGAVAPKRDTLWVPRFPGTMVTWYHAGVDTAVWFWNSSTWNKLANAGNVVTQNIANASLKANGTYLQNWNHDQLLFDTVNWFQVKGFENDATFSTRKTKYTLKMFPDFSALPLDFSIQLRNVANNADSLNNGFFVSGNITTLSAIAAPASGTLFAQAKANANSGAPNVDIRAANAATRTSFITVFADSIDVSGAVAAATADSIFAFSKFKSATGSNKLLKIPIPVTGGAGTLTSVGLTMPTAFTVTSTTANPITTNGTFNVTANGTSAQYIKGNGVLGTTDTSMIPSFFTKVRSLFSGTSPITYNTFTGAIGINNATSTGTKGAASFTSSFQDNGSGQIDLATLVSAGSCTGCTLNIDAKGRITSYATGSGGATNNVNVGSGFRILNATTQEMRTLFAGFGTVIDSVSNTNGLTWRADTTRGTGLPTKYYIDSSIAANTITVSNGLTKTGNNIKIGGTLIDAVTDIDNSGNTFFLHGTGVNVLRTVNGTFQSNISTSQISGQITANNSATNKFSEVDAVEGSAYLVGGKNGVFYNQINADSDKVFLATKFNTTPHKFILDTLGQIKIDAYTGTNFQTIDTSYNSLVVDGSGNVFKRSGGSGGGGAPLNNIGSGYRWVATAAGNIKTVFGSNTISIDSASNSNALTIKADTSILATQYALSLKPKVYNVVSYGAKGDGKKVFDAAISSGSTTLASSSANFTSGDVGKAIRIPYAGASGVDLITTIAAFVNSTTVVLANSASTSVTADTIVWGRDNTNAFQAALDTCYKNGGGTVFIPNGIYMFSGTLRTNVNGTNPNCQIYLPTSFFNGNGDSTFSNRTNILIKGETAPEWTPNLLFDDSVVSWKGTILYSLIDGSGAAPALFGTKSRLNVSDSLNYTTYAFMNLTILVAKNIHGGGPSIGGINCYFCNTSNFENISITFDGSAKSSVRPVNEIAGLISNKIFSETMTTLLRVHVAGFKYGIAVSDHADLDQCEVYFCDKAYVLLHNVETVHGNRLLAQWNISSVYCPNSTILGLNNSYGAAYFKFDNLQVEVWNGDATGWWNYSYIIDDAANNGIGEITYLIDQAGCCVNNALFNKNNGTGIICKQLGAYEDNAWQKINSVDLQNRNSGNVGIGGPPLAKFHVNTSTTGFGEIRINNSNASGQEGFQASNDIGLTGGIRVKGSSAGAYGAYVANATTYYSTATGGMALLLDANADFTVSCGSGGPPPVRLKIAGAGGAITFNSAYTFPTADGSVGQVLQTNGSGVLTFQTPSGSTTLYSGDGTLAGNRSVSGGANTLQLGTSGSKISTLTSNVSSAFSINSDSKINLFGAFILNNKAANDADYTVTATDEAVRLPAISANRTVTINFNVADSGKILSIYNDNNSANTWNIGTAVITAASGATFSFFENQTHYLLQYIGVGGGTSQWRVLSFEGYNPVHISSSNVTMAYSIYPRVEYIAQGTTSTYTLPTVSSSKTGFAFSIKNQGSGAVTINSNGGGNDIYNTSATNTYSLAAGASVNLMFDGTYFNVK